MEWKRGTGRKFKRRIRFGSDLDGETRSEKLKRCIQQSYWPPRRPKKQISEADTCDHPIKFSSAITPSVKQPQPLIKHSHFNFLVVPKKNSDKKKTPFRNLFKN